MTAATRPIPLAPRLVKRLMDYLVHGFLGGPRVVKLAWLVNLHKGGTFAVLGALMWIYGNGSAAAFVYLALHGSYGLVWLIKALTFPDARWERRVTYGSAAIVFFGGLVQYWAIGWLLISRTVVPDYPLPDPVWFGLCIALHTIGLAIVVAADAQKNFTLRVRKDLITDGMFRFIRHPNYLGEMMLYSAYALMVWTWYPWLVLGVVWVGVFWTNMHAVEASLSRYPGWEAYRARTGCLLPRLIRRR